VRVVFRHHEDERGDVWVPLFEPDPDTDTDADTGGGSSRTDADAGGDQR
jgi:hypothetical protein